jgi:hypothetical protein
MSIIKKNLTTQNKEYNMPYQDEQKEEKEEHDEDSKNNTLSNEIDSWNNFEYALREESRLLFNKMLSECRENDQLNHCLWS